MHNTFWQLTSCFAHLERKAIPPSWAARAALAPYATYRDAAFGARHCQTDLERSDATIRALIEIAADPNEREHAHLVLLTALAPVLRAKMPAFTRRPGPSALAVVNDALVELALVVAEPGDTIRLDHLAYRLVNRTRTRLWKQHHKTTGQPVPADLAGQMIEDPSARVDEQALAATELVEFRRAVQRGLDSGDITEAAWGTYRDSLSRHLDSRRRGASTSGERMRELRAVRMVDRAIAGPCNVHDY